VGHLGTAVPAIQKSLSQEALLVFQVTLKNQNGREWGAYHPFSIVPLLKDMLIMLSFDHTTFSQTKSI
jgi:hypothetical protein